VFKSLQTPPGRPIMNLRERLLLTVHFQRPDRVPNFEIGFWDETVERWYKEGLPSYIH
jgi:hypothetical protein